ncbi:hypothetical protein MTO96_050108, partial [Rhipicephalus appendiculatus]
RKEHQDKHCLYLLHRIRGPTYRDPIALGHFERRMSQAVDLLKKRLIPEHAAIEVQEPPPAAADSSIQRELVGYYSTWCGGWCY